MEGDSIVIPSDKESNRIPMIHYKNIISLINNIFDPSYDPSILFSTCYLAACDNCETSIGPLITQVYS